MTVVTGGRVYNPMSAPTAAAPEGIILPKKRTVSDVSGRIFLFFVDDQHLQFGNTGRVRELFKKISKELVHEGDLFGIVSSGPSSIQVDMTYDRSRLDETIKKMTGNELKPTEIINGAGGPGGPTEIRYRARRVFDDDRRAQEPRSGAQPPQGDHLGERRYDFAPFGRALRDDGSQFAVRAERQRAGAQPGAAQSAQANGAGPLPQHRPGHPAADGRNSSPTRTCHASCARSRRRRTARTPPSTRSTRAVWSVRWPTSTRTSIPSSGASSSAEPGQPAHAGRGNRRHRGGEHQRLHQSVEAWWMPRQATTTCWVLPKNPDILKRRRVVDVRVTRAGLTVWARKDVLKPQPAVPSTKQ